MTDRLDVHEPADPSDGGPDGRRGTRLGPDTLQPENSATPLWECGCQECPPFDDPLSDVELPVYAADECATPRLMTIERAKEAYVRYQSASNQSDTRTSRYQRALSTYRHILEADRLLQCQYDDLSTAMVTRRQSPLDDSDDWIPPVTLHSRLANTFDSVRKAIHYRLARKHGLDYEYVALTAHTTSCATPHQHIVLWIDDPANELKGDMLQPAVDKHVSMVPTAYHQHHQPASDAVTVQHTPDTVDPVPEHIGRILRQSDAASADDTSMGNQGVPAPIAAVQYVSQQHPHLFLGHVVDDLERDVTNLNTLLDGAATAWASPYRSVTSSSGVSLN